jgi:hypothetical protein
VFAWESLLASVYAWESLLASVTALAAAFWWERAP